MLVLMAAPFVIDAAPANVGDAACWHIRLERAAATLVHCLDYALRTRFQILEIQGPGMAHEPIDGERPSRRIDARNAEMGNNEEVIRGGYAIRHLVRTQLQATNPGGRIHCRPDRPGGR